MSFSSPATRASLLLAIFATLLCHIVILGAFARFVHKQAQHRILMPEHYDVQVVTADDYRRLADPAVRKLTLEDGSTIEKARVWDDVVLPGYKPTRDGGHYVLVTTLGTAHLLGYLEPPLLLLGIFAACGVIASGWNAKLLAREATAGKK